MKSCIWLQRNLQAYKKLTNIIRKRCKIYSCNDCCCEKGNQTEGIFGHIYKKVLSIYTSFLEKTLQLSIFLLKEIFESFVSCVDLLLGIKVSTFFLSNLSRNIDISNLYNQTQLFTESDDLFTVRITVGYREWRKLKSLLVSHF